MAKEFSKKIRDDALYLAEQNARSKRGDAVGWFLKIASASLNDRMRIIKILREHQPTQDDKKQQ